MTDTTVLVIDLNEHKRMLNYTLHFQHGIPLQSYPVDYWVCDPATGVPQYPLGGKTHD